METEREGDFVVKTGGHCFLCLSKVDNDNADQLPSVKVEPDTEEQDSFRPKESVSPLLVSLQYLSCYLKLNLGTVSRPTPKARLEKPRIKAILCEGCGDLNERFPELHRERDRIQTGVTTCVSGIHGKLSRSEEEAALAVRDPSNESFREKDARILEAVRKRVKEKCLLKLERPPPRAETDELGPHLEVDVERTNVKIENDPFDDANGGPSWNASEDDESPWLKLEVGADEAYEVADSITFEERSTRISPRSSVEINLGRNPATGRFTCPSPTCEKEFTIRRSAERHYRSLHLKLENLACHLCGKVLSDTSSLTQHMNSVHLNLRPYECNECGKKFARKHELQRHQESFHTSVKRHQCDLCEKRFPGEQHLRRHRRLVHLILKREPSNARERSRKLSRKSIQSSRTPKSSAEVRIYPNTTTTTGEFHGCECEECGKTFSCRSTLNGHIEAVHLQIKHECEECGELFSWPENLRRHRKKFHDPSSLRNHVKRIQQKNRRQSCLNPTGESVPGRKIKKPSPLDTKQEDHRVAEDENMLGIASDQVIESFSMDSVEVPEGPASRSQPDAVPGAEVEKEMDAETVQRLLEECAKMSFERNPITGKFICPGCDKEFPRMYEVRQHYRSVHLKAKRFPCDLCGKRHATRGDLNKHYQAVHLKLRPFRCDECGKGFTQRVSLKLHWEFVHLKLKQYWCYIDKCRKQFGSEGELQDHQKSVHLKLKVKQYRCDECGARFKTNSQVIRHKRTVHPSHLKVVKGRKWKCDVCGKKFTQKYNLQRHRKRVHLESKFMWDECGKQYPTERDLQLHHKKAHSSRKMQNPEISKPDSQERDSDYNLEVKLEPHSPSAQVVKEKEEQLIVERGKEEPDRDRKPSFQTNEAGFDVTPTMGEPSISYYTYDKSTRQFKCDLCDKVTLSPHDAHVHYRQDHVKATNQKTDDGTPVEHQCDQCGKKFGRADSLRHHYNTVHLGQGFKCPVCQKTFVRRDTAKVHLISCKGRNAGNIAGNCKCPLCGKEFGGTEAFWAHCDKEHSRAKNVCEQCGREFTRKSDMKRHQEIVCNGGKQAEKVEFPCPECGQLTRKYCLYVHYKNKHPEIKFSIRMLDN